MTRPGGVIIVGSGPSGVSAAWPLVEAGVDVVMLDAGTPRASEIPAERPDLVDIRAGGAGMWRYLLRPDLSGLRQTADTSPKIRCAMGVDFEAGYLSGNHLAPSGYTTIGALAVGGLSNVWGANVPAYDDADLDGFPISPADLAPSYHVIAGRVGVSRNADDTHVNGMAVPSQPGLPLSGIAGAVYARYQAAKDAMGLAMAPVRNAVLTEAAHGRAACNLCGTCMWGCGRNAIYNSAFDLEVLMRRPNFTFLPGSLVVRLTLHSRSGYTVHVVDPRSRRPREMVAKTVILAAGTFPSTRLVLALQNRYDQTLPLLTTPGCAAAFSMPSKLSEAMPDKLFGMGQLALKFPLSDRPWDYVYGILFEAAAMPFPDLIAGMPLSRVGAMRLARFLLPSLTAILFNFPGEYGDCHVRLARPDDGEPAKLIISGRQQAGFPALVQRSVKKIAKELRTVGLHYLPTSAQLYGPGAVNHHVGTLPMGSETSSFGEVRDCPGLFVVDGSVFNRLPAKNHTFTVMANADRIGRYIAHGVADVAV